MVIGRKRRRLDDENVFAAHIFLDLDKDLHVREPPDDRLGQGYLEIFANLCGKRMVAVAGQEFHFGQDPSRRAALVAISPRLCNAAYLSLPVRIC
jgi:hypothetical protein